MHTALMCCCPEQLGLDLDSRIQQMNQCFRMSMAFHNFKNGGTLVSLSSLILAWGYQQKKKKHQLQNYQLYAVHMVKQMSSREKDVW